MKDIALTGGLDAILAAADAAGFTTQQMTNAASSRDAATASA